MQTIHATEPHDHLVQATMTSITLQLWRVHDIVEELVVMHGGASPLVDASRLPASAGAYDSDRSSMIDDRVPGPVGAEW